MHYNNHHLAISMANTGMALRALAVAALSCAAALPAQAQNLSVTPSQRSTAQQVAHQGVPLAELSQNAPEAYVVKRGDTLWDISKLYLLRPWRWPELWGMNLQTIANPHLIYPGQTLYLDKQNGFARLRTSASSASGALETVRISPRTRSESLSDTALPTLKQHLIEPFLIEALVVDTETISQAPRIVATLDQRVLMSTGDRAYARGTGADTLTTDPGQPRFYRVFRDATALKDPISGEILGYEAQYVGQAQLIRGESFEETSNGKSTTVEPVPATLDITAAKEEIRAGDRLLPAPARAFLNYTPHAPQGEVDARVVSLYGSIAVANAAQNQVITINQGEHDGIEPGHVLHLLTQGERIKDRTDAAKTVIRLPSERNGTAMVFRTFDRVSYALILDVRTTVHVGDRLVNPE